MPNSFTTDLQTGEEEILPIKEEEDFNNQEIED